MTRTEHFQEIASAKRLETLTKAINAIELLSKTGETITIASIATKSGVSRSWLYNEPLVKTLIAGFSKQSDSQVSLLVSTVEQVVARLDKLEGDFRSVQPNNFHSSVQNQQN